jgi:hypothetical protein
MWASALRCPSTRAARGRGEKRATRQASGVKTGVGSFLSVALHCIPFRAMTNETLKRKLAAANPNAALREFGRNSRTTERAARDSRVTCGRNTTKISRSGPGQPKDCSPPRPTFLVFAIPAHPPRTMERAQSVPLVSPSAWNGIAIMRFSTTREFSPQKRQLTLFLAVFSNDFTKER